MRLLAPSCSSSPIAQEHDTIAQHTTRYAPVVLTTLVRYTSWYVDEWRCSTLVGVNCWCSTPMVATLRDRVGAILIAVSWCLEELIRIQGEGKHVPSHA